jgi:hypothetical protein
MLTYVRKSASYAEIGDPLSLQTYSYRIILNDRPSTYHVFMAYLDVCFDNIKTRKYLWKIVILFALSKKTAENPPSGGLMCPSVCQNASCVPGI